MSTTHIPITLNNIESTLSLWLIAAETVVIEER